METNNLIEALEALGQQTRLEVVRLLLRHEPKGLSSGDVARKLKVPMNTMSSHLARLGQAKLVKKERRSRFIIYRAERENLGRCLSSLRTLLADPAKASGRRSV
jgi:ArsR family transcriptional regulator